MRTKSGRGDVLLVCMVLFLVVFGLAVLYSTGSYNGSVRFGDAFYYMKKQFFCSGTRDACHVPDQLYGLPYF